MPKAKERPVLVATAPIAATAPEGWTPVRACRVCGCTDDDCSRCIRKTGAPCSWVAENLCSACVPSENIDAAA